jgi:quinol monooxygenase YgiN
VTLLVYLEIKEGKLPEFMELTAKMCEAVKTEADTLAYGFYMSDNKSTCTVREVYKNGAAFLAHGKNCHKLLMQLGPLTTWKGADLHGPKNEIDPLRAMPMLQQNCGFWEEARRMSKL